MTARAAFSRSVCASAARGAHAVERDLVPGEPESLGEERLEVARASLDIERLAAHFAVEVVVVLEARGLVKRGLAWQFDLDDLALFEQGVDVAIDRREGDRGDVGTADLEEFLRPEGPVGSFDRIADRGPLPGVAWLLVLLAHGGSWGADAGSQPRSDLRGETERGGGLGESVDSGACDAAKRDGRGPSAWLCSCIETRRADGEALRWTD